MGEQTKIEYCDSTINPVVGCSGCELYSRDAGENHCYAARLVRRYAGRPGWPRRFEEPMAFPERIEKALRWPDLRGTRRPDKPWLDGKPRVVFVNDLGDGFCPAAPPVKVWLYPYLERMAASPHIWLFLSKWPLRMFEAFAQGDVWRGAPNFWFGTSYTGLMCQGRLMDLRLFAGAGGTTWVSLEPLLGPVVSELVGFGTGAVPGSHPLGFLNWVVVGGETGPGARRAELKWFLDIYEACRDWQVPYFFKQWGDRCTWMDSRLGAEDSGGNDVRAPWEMVVRET
jgi:protein gp37